MTSTLIKRLALTLIILSSLASASAYSVDAEQQYNYFSIPEYDSQSDIAINLVVPFLLITILLQIALQRALMFTLDEKSGHWFGKDPQYKSERAKIKKQSTILALLIAGMIIPTPIFQSLNEYTAIIFGGATYIFIGAILIGFLLVLWSGIKSGSRKGE